MRETESLPSLPVPEEPSPLSAALILTVILSTSHGTDSTLGKDLSFCCQSYLDKDKEEGKFSASNKTINISPCISETPSPATQPPTASEHTVLPRHLPPVPKPAGTAAPLGELSAGHRHSVASLM